MMKSLRAIITKGTLYTAAFVLAVSSLTAAAPYVASQVASAMSGNELHVSDTGSNTTDCTDIAQPCATITHALSEASNGDTINVAAGTYTESFVVDKSVAIVGAGQGNTIIKAPAVFANNLDFISIRGAGVNATIKNVTLDSESTAYKYGSAAVSVSAGANATIENSTIYNYGYNGISNFAHGGIYVKGANAYATIRNNIIKPLASSTGLLNGIVIEYGANANIQNNTITGNWYYGDDKYSGSGIGVWDNANETTVIKNNTITGNQVGLAFVTDSPAALTNVNTAGITGNNTDVRSDAHVYPQYSGWPWAAPSTVYIDSSNAANTHGIVMADGKAVIKGYNLFSNAQDAVDAVADNGTVKLLRDISVNSSILITKPLTFDGNGLSVVSSFGAGATSQYSGVIEVQNVSNGIVRFVANSNKAFRVHGEGSKAIQGPGSYNGLHGINVYNSNVKLNKVILSNNGKSGLNVGRNSNAVVNDITTRNNTWYGINVDKTKSGLYSTLTVNGTSTHEEGDKPHIFSDVRANVEGGSVKVTDPNKQYARYHQDAGFSYVLDLSAPEVELTVDAYNPESFTVHATDDQRIMTIGYSIWKDGERIGVWGQGEIAWADKNEFNQVKTDYKSTETGKYHALNTLKDGSYVIYAAVTDVLGKTANSKAASFIVDRTLPEVTITSQQKGTVNGAPSFKWSENVFVKVDEKDLGITEIFRAGETDAVQTHVGDEFTLTKDRSLQGRFYIVHTDKAGNKSEPVYFELHQKPASITDLKGLGAEGETVVMSPNGNMKISFNVSKNGGTDIENVSVRVKQGTGWKGADAFTHTDTSGEEGIYEVDLAGIAGLTHGAAFEVQIQAKNAAGEHVTIKRTIVIDTEAPTVTIPSYNTNGDVITPAATSNDDDATYSWVLVSGSPAGLAPFDSNALAPAFTALLGGTYILELTATDAAGNSSVTPFTFTYAVPATVIPALTTPATGGAASNTGDFSNVTADSIAIPEVLGAQTEEPTQEVKGAATESVAQAANTDAKENSIGNLAWYWWTLIAAAVVGLIWWIIAATRRRNSED